MGKRQTRRSISVKGTTYARLKSLVESRNIQIDTCPHAAERPKEYDRWSCSNLLEQLIADACESARLPEVKVAPAYYPNKRKPEDDEIISQHFTF